MPNEQNNIYYRKHEKLLAKSLIALVFVCSITAITVRTILERKSDACTTTLILKADVCQYLRHEGVSAESAPVGDTMCSVSVLFSKNSFDNGGVIHLGERRLRIADNQIIATEALPTPDQLKAQVNELFWILFLTATLLGMMGWLAFI